MVLDGLCALPFIGDADVTLAVENDEHALDTMIEAAEIRVGEVGIIADSVVEENVEAFDTDPIRVEWKIEAVRSVPEKGAMKGPLD